MKAVFCYDGPLYKDDNGNYYDSILNDQMFERYLKVASELEIIIRTRSIDADSGKIKMGRLTNPQISVVECPNLSSIRGYVFDKNTVKKILKQRLKIADIVFIRLPSVIGNIAVDVCKDMSKKYIIEVVGCPWDSYWNYSIKGKFIAPIAKCSMKRRIVSAPYVLYVTNRFLQKRYPTKGKSINCSNVELPEFDDVILKERIEKIKGGQDVVRIGTAAGLDVRYKGQQYVIRALEELKNNGITNVEYQLIGGGTGDYLKSLAQKCGVESQVRIIGQMPHDMVFDWLNNLDVYIQPSRQEGLPRSVIEAMSRAVPCLGARTAGIPELISEDCVFSNGTNEVEEIAHLLTELLNSKQRMIELAKMNFDEAHNYRRDLLVERRTAFFTRCINDT